MVFYAARLIRVTRPPSMTIGTPMTAISDQVSGICYSAPYRVAYHRWGLATVYRARRNAASAGDASMSPLRLCALASTSPSVIAISIA